jgi:hypothetical protein
MMSEGPTEPTVSLPAAKSRVGSTWIAVGVAVVALLLSLVATSISLYALSRGPGGTKTDAGGTPKATVAATSTGGQLESPRPADSPSATTSPTQLDVLSPEAQCETAYKTQELNPMASSSDTTYIDLDEPRVLQSREKSDLYVQREYTTSAVPFFVFESGTEVAMAQEPTVQPADCANLIRTAPVQDRQRVPAQRGNVICVATSLAAAAEAGIKQKMVVIYVTDLPSSGRVTIRLSAWKIPG